MAVDEDSDSSEEELAGKSHKQSNRGFCGLSPQKEILCGITVALALVPEAVAFALAAGLAPSVGLNSAWIIAVGTAVLGGRPAMICGATGSLAVLVPSDLLHSEEFGNAYLFYAVILMGALEITLGLIGVGSLVKLIPTPVMIGFCNGLALVIGLAQFNNFKMLHHGDDTLLVNSTVVARRLGSFDAFTDGVPFVSGDVLMWACAITALSFAICTFLPKVTTKVPSALVAIVVGTALEWGVVRAALHSQTSLVGDIAALGGSFPMPIWFDKGIPALPPPTMVTLNKVIQLSITMAVVGLLESLMTLNLIDEITKTKGDTMRECIGQGVSNIACGALGGMGGCAMIGQSMININAGARSRLSSLVAGLFLLMILLVGYPAINIIPVSALVGVMFNVVYNTFEWGSLKLMAIAALPEFILRKSSARNPKTSRQQIRRADALIILAVTLVTLFTNLAEAVVVGMIISFCVFAYESSDLISVTSPESSEVGVKSYHVQGLLFFGSTTKFLTLFDEAKDPDDVRLIFRSGYVADYSAVQALNKLGERYGAYGKKVTIQELHPRSSHILTRASGLLVEEINLDNVESEVLPTDGSPAHLNVEAFNGGVVLEPDEDEVGSSDEERAQPSRTN